MRMNFFPRLLKRLESLSCFFRKKGEYNAFNSSKLLSVTSSISWDHDCEKQYHLSNNPHPIHKISRYTMLSYTVQSLKVPRVIQQCAVFQCAREIPVICCANTSFPPGASLFGSNSDSAAAGREIFPLQQGILPCRHLWHILVISPAWQVDFLFTDSTQTAVIKGEWDSPRDKPAKAKCRACTNEAAQTMRSLYLWKTAFWGEQGQLQTAMGCVGPHASTVLSVSPTLYPCGEAEGAGRKLCKADNRLHALFWKCTLVTIAKNIPTAFCVSFFLNFLFFGLHM